MGGGVCSGLRSDEMDDSDNDDAAAAASVAAPMRRFFCVVDEDSGEEAGAVPAAMSAVFLGVWSEAAGRGLLRPWSSALNLRLVAFILTSGDWRPR